MKNTFDFDKVYDRRHSFSIKYDAWKDAGVPEDALPMWVADMDFPSPPCVQEALKDRSQSGFFGYSSADESYYSTVKKWFRERFSYMVESEEILLAPGIVLAIYIAIKAFTSEGDGILIQRPVYYPFSNAIIGLQRKLVNNPLVFKNGKYEIDFEDFERKIVENQVKFFILCSPHNPVGRVWKKDELERMADICISHDVLIISDEIHADFTYPGYSHVMFPSVREGLRDRTIICTAPSKTFNLAGLQISNIIISNPELREKYKEVFHLDGHSESGIMGIVACKAAYEKGGEWLSALLEYLKGNLDWIRDFLKKELPWAELVEPEGTYLVWISFEKSGFSDEEIKKRLLEKGKLWLDEGTMFGPEGAYYQRFNIAAPRTLIEDAFRRVVKAFQD